MEVDTFDGISGSIKWGLSAYTWNNWVLNVMASACKLVEKSGSDGLLAKKNRFYQFS